MGALAPVTPWIPEDDLLLKNAVEAGASLESLAKGAVQFSRRFTIRELQERWHSLLYDPVVSAEASFRMAELERSNPNFPTKFGRTGNSKESKSSFGKRNAEKVRSSYHSLRKKFRNEPFNSEDLGFFVPQNDNQFIGNGDETHLGLEDSHMDIIHRAFPELADDGCVTGFNNPIEDNHHVQKDSLQDGIPHTVGGNLAFVQDAGSLGCNAVHEDSKLKMQTAVPDPKSTTPSTDCFLAELSNSLLNDVDHFMDVDGKDIDKSYYDGLSSLLVNSANNTSQGSLLNSAEQESSPDQTHLGDAILGGQEMSKLEGTHVMSPSETKPSNDAPALDPHPEIVNGVICCLLNMEDPDIPCNDDIFLSNNCHPMSVSSLARRNFKDSANPISASVKDLSASKERSVGYPVHMQKKNPGQSQASSQGKLETGQPSQGIECRPDSHNTVPMATAITSGVSGSAEPCSNVPQAVMLKDVDKEITTTKHFPTKTSMGSDGHRSYTKKDVCNSKLEQDVLAVNNPAYASNADDSSTEIAVSEPEVNPTADEHLDDSDEDLPNYSDIEAMILDMDLDPDDQDVFDLEVSKYQNEDTKRAIIRLEQAACSYMQRAIASHGAFAVLYGRHSKHYIKKPEVLLGRSTEDFLVDIDLGREKRGSKISRRQAIICLENDGSFHMKNLGKYPISVNEKEVDTGQSLILSSNSLIEIRGMPFIFETNQSRIKRHLDSMGKGNRDRIKPE